jgi:hypothetical protein
LVVVGVTDRRDRRIFRIIDRDRGQLSGRPSKSSTIPRKYPCQSNLKSAVLAILQRTINDFYNLFEW